MIRETQTETEPARRTACPVCGQKGKRVSTVTLAALLRDEFARRFSAGGHSRCGTDGAGCQPLATDTGWRFCDSPDCDVVYFSEEGDTTYVKAQLKVPVGVKERTGDRPLCYCFGHSVASIKQELRTKGRSDAIADIRAKMKALGCRCEIANPSGSCCLGSVAKGIQIAQKEIAQEQLNTCHAEVHTPANAGSPRGAGTGQSHQNGEGGAASDSFDAGQAKQRGAFLAILGAVFAAILGSACCWLPLLLIAFGFSAAGVGSFFEEYRPYFLAVACTLLGMAWYVTYRTSIRQAWALRSGKSAPVAAVEACCAGAVIPTPPQSSYTTEAQPEHAKHEDCCAPRAETAVGSGYRWFTVRQFNRAMLWMGTVLVLLVALFPHWIGLLVGGKSTTGFKPDDQQQVVLEITGMSCPGCAAAIEKAIRGVAGVSAASVNYEKSEAIVFVPKGHEVPRDAILQAVRLAGYAAEFRK